MAKKDQQTNILFGVIIALLVVIAVLAFFVGKNMGGGNGPVGLAKDFHITVIDDERCQDCQTDAFVAQLAQVPALAGIEFETKDFSDTGVADMLKAENITVLPAFIFSHNAGLPADISGALQALPSGNFRLNVEGLSFNPFAERSERGFLTLDTQQLTNIKKDTYVQGNPEATITWLEYSDLECPFCARLHSSGTPTELKEKYGDELNVVFQHYPLDFHPNAKTGSQIAECLGEQKGADAFYALIKTSFENGNSTTNFLLDEAVKLGGDRTALESCLENETYKAKVESQMQTGNQLFGVTGTPGNVLINNITGEYEVLSGAYPTDNFVTIIERLK